MMVIDTFLLGSGWRCRYAFDFNVKTGSIVKMKVSNITLLRKTNDFIYAFCMVDLIKGTLSNG